MTGFPQLFRALAASLLLCCLSAPALSAAGKIVVSPDTTVIRFGEHFHYMMDYSNQWRVEPLYKQRHDFSWKKTQDEGGSIGMSSSPVWLRTQFSTSQDLRGMYVLNLGSNTAESHEVFLFENGQLVEEFRLGNKMLIEQRPIPSEDFLVSVQLHPDKHYDLLLKIVSHTWIDVPLSLEPINHFIKSKHRTDLGTGLMYGIFFAAILYNLLLYLSSREKAYGYLVPTISSLVLFFSSLDQTAFLFIWPSWPVFNDFMLTISGMLVVISTSLFTQSFLSLKRRFTIAYTVLNGVIGCACAVILLNIFDPRSSLIIPAVALVMLIGFLLFIVTGIIIAARGNRSAIFYVLAWLPITCVMIWLAVNLLGIAQSNIDPFWDLLRISTCAQVMLLSLAVGSRLRFLAERRNKAEEVSRAKSDVIARVSHEIRTPMNGILGLSHLLQDRLKDDPEGAHYNEMIHQSGTALLGVINDLLDLAKVESNKMDLESIPLRLPDIAEQSRALFQHQTDEKEIDFTLNVAPSVPGSVAGDPTRIRQIILNLLSNALKFTPHNGKIHLNLHTDENNVTHISVTDTGCGIPIEQQAQLFDAFTQASTDVVRKHGGSGLGLFICKRLANLMGGNLTLESQEGHGSTFTFSVPLPICETSQEASPSVLPNTLEQLTVLVAEDNAVNQLVVKKILAKMGHHVIITDNGDEAFRRYKQQHDKLDLVLMDCEMPVMNGYEATTAIREYEEEQQLPRKLIIALTAHALSDHREICLGCGMDDELHKPLQIEELKAILIQLSESSSSPSTRKT